MDTGPLEEIGLTKSEIKVYLALLELGSTTTGPIVEKSGAASSKVYEVLEKLMQKGLASFVIKSGMRYFEAAPPSNIIDILRQKEDRLREQTAKIKHLLPAMESLKSAADTSETLVFKGMEGAKTAFRDILTTSPGEEITIMGLSEASEQFKQFLLRFHQKRAKLKVKVRALFGSKMGGFIEELSLIPHTKVKVFPPGFETQAGTITYQDKTLYSLPKDHLWIQIKNSRLAEANRQHFNRMWNQEVQIMRGEDGVKFLLEEASKPTKESEVLCLGMQAGVYRYSPKLFDWFFKKCEDNRLKWKYLCDPQAKPFEDKFLARSTGFVELKYLSEEVMSPTVIWIFGDTVATIVWQKEPIVTFIFNKDIADHYKKYFDYLWAQDSTTLKGFDGIKKLCEKVIETKQDLYLIGANMQLLENYPNFFKDFESRRLKSGINRHTLAMEGKRASPFTKLKNARIRFLPKEFGSPMVIWVFGDFVAQTLWNRPETVFLINNKAVAQDYRKYFDLLWKTASE